MTRALAALLLLGVAHAAPGDRAARFTVENGQLALSIETPDLIDAALKRKLDSGLATTVVVRAYLLEEGVSRAQALAVQTLRVAYDLWDEVYVFDITGEGGRRVLREKKRDDAIHRIAGIDRLPIIGITKILPTARYRVAVIIEVDPVSPALLQQVRRWLSRPREGTPVDGESYFGSFVSLFVHRKVGEAERVLRFRTEAFSPSEVRK